MFGPHLLGRRALVGAAVAAAIGLGASAASAQAPQFFRIGTGSAGGVYYPIGGILATAISNPPGSRPCAEGGSCGVPGLIAVAQSTQGSVQNVNLIQSGNAESGLVQSDVAYWSFTATGLFQGRPKFDRLRFIAHIYPEHIHAVVRKDSPYRSLTDLRGKRIGIGLQASGARVGAELILEANGMVANRDFRPEYLNTQQSTERLQDNNMDAMLTVTGYPSGGIAEFCSRTGCRLLTFTDAQMQQVIAKAPFYGRGTIPRTAYEGLEADVPTLTVGAQWLVSSAVPDALVYEITKALWNANTRKLLDAGHAKGREIQRAHALEGRGVPFHPGAERFYREAGMLR